MEENDEHEGDTASASGVGSPGHHEAAQTRSGSMRRFSVTPPHGKGSAASRKRVVRAPDRSGAAHDTEIIAAVGPDSPVRPVAKKSRLLPTVLTCVLCGETAATEIKVAT